MNEDLRIMGGPWPFDMDVLKKARNIANRLYIQRVVLLIVEISARIFAGAKILI